MTKEEALIFFKLGEDQDLEDAYELGLFEFKQFFLSKLPLVKVFHAKLAKMDKWNRAYSVLANENPSEVESDLMHDARWHFEDDVLAAFSKFQEDKRFILLDLQKSEKADDLKTEVLKLLSLHQAYWSLWITEKELDFEITQLTKEPDPMELLSAIRTFNLKGGLTFDDLYRDEFREELLLIESKRLTLLLNS